MKLIVKEHCQDCKELIDSIKAKNIEVEIINCETNPEIIKEYNISIVPTLILEKEKFFIEDVKLLEQLSCQLV